MRFVKQTSGNTFDVDLSKVNETHFIEAIRVRDIRKMRVLSRQQKEELGLPAGSPKVELTDISGKKMFIDEKTLMKTFVLSNNSRIKLRYIRSGQYYYVYRQCNEPCKALLLPSNCTGKFMGKVIKPSSYIIMSQVTSGNDINNQIDIISKDMFHKAYSIPRQDRIEKYIGRASSNREFIPGHSKQGKRQRNIVNTPKREIFNNKNSNVVPERVITQQIDNAIQQQNHTNKQSMVSKVQSSNNESDYKYRAVAKLLNNDKKQIGFVIEEIATGKRKSIPMSNVVKMCSLHSVENIMLVTNDQTGKKYLRGNGIRIESLPELLA